MPIGGKGAEGKDAVKPASTTHGDDLPVPAFPAIPPPNASVGDAKAVNPPTVSSDPPGAVDAPANPGRIVPAAAPSEDAPTDTNPNRQEPAVRLEWAGPAIAKLGVPAGYVLAVHNICSIPVQQVLVRFKVQVTSTSLTEPVIKMEATHIYSDTPNSRAGNEPAPQRLAAGGGWAAGPWPAMSG
jgi:hypothetical protein